MKTVSSLKWFGGQTSSVPHIIKFMNVPHTLAVDLFCGSGSLTINKVRAGTEFMIDSDSRVTTTLRVIREDAQALAEQLWLTPWSQEEFALAISDEGGLSDLEIARRFAFACTASIRGGSAFATSDFRVTRDPAGRYSTASHDIDLLIGRLYGLSSRLRGVQILKGDAIEFLIKRPRRKGSPRIVDIPDSLIMADPPFTKSERSQQNGYAHEVDDQFHMRLFEALNQAVGYAFVLGYESDLYRELYEAAGWKRFDTARKTNSGGSDVLSLWANPSLANFGRQLNLFHPEIEPTSPALEVAKLKK